MFKALGLELDGPEFNTNLRHLVMKIEPEGGYQEGRTLTDNSSSRTEDVILGK